MHYILKTLMSPFSVIFLILPLSNFLLRKKKSYCWRPKSMVASTNLPSNSPFKRASVSSIMTWQVNMFELIVYLYVCLSHWFLPFQWPRPLESLWWIIPLNVVYWLNKATSVGEISSMAQYLEDRYVSLQWVLCSMYFFLLLYFEQQLKMKAWI